jgi:hypothetical protein
VLAEEGENSGLSQGRFAAILAAIASPNFHLQYGIYGAKLTLFNQKKLAQEGDNKNRFDVR